MPVVLPDPVCESCGGPVHPRDDRCPSCQEVPT